MIYKLAILYKSMHIRICGTRRATVEFRPCDLVDQPRDNCTPWTIYSCDLRFLSIDWIREKVSFCLMDIFNRCDTSSYSESNCFEILLKI